MAHHEFGRHVQGLTVASGHEGAGHRYPRSAADLLQSLGATCHDSDSLTGDWESAWVDLGGEG